MLRSIDMQPDWTVTGKEAVLRAQDAAELNDEYKVYIVDYLIPDMNGIETIRRIRKVIHEDVPRMDGYTAMREIRTLPNNRKANIPIVAMTANAFDEDRRKAFACGMNGHIVKPIDMKVIAKILNQIFKETK